MMFRLRFRAVPWIMLTLVLPASAEPRFQFQTTPGGLPKDVRPIAYRIDLDLVPYPNRLASADGNQSLDFKGRIEIDIEVSRSTETITFNAVELNLASVAVDGVEATFVRQDKKTASYVLPRKLTTGLHRAVIAYAGKITSRLPGLYYAIYNGASGQRRLLATHFEPNGARRMFPSWDEPVFKATFALSAVVPQSFRAISNMPILREESAGAGRKRVTFGRTPKMSTYLVVLVAGELDPPITQTVADVEVRVTAPEGRAEQGRYALQVANKVLTYFDDYFGIKYPLPKLDHIAIPNIAVSGMENWGGVIYADNVLLLDPAKSSQKTKEDIFKIVTHETAHQWSGDLVSMRWWNDVWLNEGFAVWMETKVTDRFNPNWKILLRAHDSKEAAMARDARRTARSVRREIIDDSEALSAFDEITYAKGAAVLRMLESYLGEKTFRKGVRYYMKAHAYSSARTVDLWAALTTASRKKPVEAVAASFIEYPGVPVIQVRTSCIKRKTVATLSQQRFSINDSDAEKRVWQVPVTVGRVGDVSSRMVLVKDTAVAIAFPGCGKPVKVNLGDVGYYRVQYDDAGLKALGAAYRQLLPADRLNLLSDSWAMVQAQRIEPKSYLDLTKLLAHETELAVWKSVTDILVAIDRLQRGESGRDAFRIYARSVIQPVLDRLGWQPKPDDTPEALQLRVLAITALGKMADRWVIAEARRRFESFIKDPDSLHKELRRPVMFVVGYGADRATFDDLLRRAREAPDLESKLLFYYALAGAHDPVLIDETVEIARRDKKLPDGQVYLFLVAVAYASDNPDRVWDLVFSQQEDIMSRLLERQRSLLLPQIAIVSSNPIVAFQLQWAKQSRSSVTARYEAAKAIEEVESKADIKDWLLPKVDAWVIAARGI